MIKTEACLSLQNEKVGP